MKVILITAFRNLGKVGDLIKVKSGYARNFLFPKEIALPAIKKNIEYFESRKKFLEDKKIKKLKIAHSRIKEIKKIKFIKIFAKSGDKGKLFGSINTRDISKKLNEIGFKVHKSELKLENGKLRSIGEYFVLFQPHTDVYINFKLIILPK
ncbi:50S ribosomal protein L9 [Buchnera aphidicola]|uniref:50S ribosomal protein L9 n=1 Tax=Buchnera aphidicola TaxID=9 RepID=UPI002236F1A4|nr:50S ribosomal protein L9 [Buchnera aphidicola]MCW5197451.1 50S ribosomal protein L9 [Buchnera aphidicola (Chaitophorus viminalis)]